MSVLEIPPVIEAEDVVHAARFIIAYCKERDTVSVEGAAGRIVAVAYLGLVKEQEGVIWSDEKCFALNAAQHDHRFHGYTCGTDSRHRPLIATRHGWKCAECPYTQKWSH